VYFTGHKTCGQRSHVMMQFPKDFAMTRLIDNRRDSRSNATHFAPYLLSAAIYLATATAGVAQTDYYNTDAGRPLTIEDASATERYAFELQLAPLRLERSRGMYRWEVEPEIAYGILPRTQLEIGLPLSYVDLGPGSSRSGLGGIGIALLHNLNVETTIPALAIAGDVLLPIGSLAPDEAIFSAKGIITRTFTWARFHLNGQYSFGADEAVPIEDGEHAGAEASRWLTGLAVDRTFPLRSMLIGAEIFAEKRRSIGAETQWNAALGVRRQLSPAFNVDAGIGKQLSGDDRSWFATFGLAHAFAIRSLMPGR
jgi:hypothetical protein